MPAARRAFTMVELLVVIGIIILLVGILLPAIAAVRVAAKNTRTEGTMNEFSKACDIFAQEQGFYPGVIPEDDLVADGGGTPRISGTENALLHLMGGYLIESETDPGTYAGSAGQTFNFNTRNIKVLDFQGPVDRASEMGNGPIINGRQFGAYYTPAENELGFVRGQQGELNNFKLPDLLDAWGNPIIFMRRAHKFGPLVEDGSGQEPQFHREVANPYLLATALGESSGNQTDSGGGYEAWSALNAGGSATGNSSFSTGNWNLMQVLGHQGFSQGQYSNDMVLTAPRGEYVLISAGRDGIYFSRTDGYGSGSDPRSEIPGAAVVSEYDDIVIMGGGE